MRTCSLGYNAGMAEPGKKFGDLRRLTHRAKRNLEREQDLGSEAWPKYASVIYRVESSFEPLFGTESPFQDYVQERKAAGKRTVALDLLGDGAAMRWLRPDRALSVSLSDHRDDEALAMDRRGKSDVMTGNLFKRQVWERVLQWLSQVEGDEKVFNLIIQSGSAGLKDIPEDPKFLLTIMQNLWNVLSNDDGMIAMETMPSMKHLVQPWIEQINRIPGIDAAYTDTLEFHGDHHELAYPPFKIIKHASAPSQLPGLTV